MDDDIFDDDEMENSKGGADSGDFDQLMSSYQQAPSKKRQRESAWLDTATDERPNVTRRRMR